jgi:hypothetical protein
MMRRVVSSRQVICFPGLRHFGDMGVEVDVAELSA